MVWLAFARIRTTRVNGMGLGRIPWHEAVRWAEREGFDEQETDSLVDLIERLDLEEHVLDEEGRKKKGEPTDGENS